MSCIKIPFLNFNFTFLIEIASGTSMVLSGWRIGFRGRKFSQLLMSKKFSAQIRGNRYFRRIRSYQMWFIGNPHCEVLMWEILLLAHGPTKDLGKSDTTMGFPQSIHRQWLPQRRTFETLLSVALGGGCREDLAGRQHRRTRRTIVYETNRWPSFSFSYDSRKLLAI